MARVAFTANLERHVACPPAQVDAATLGAALEQAFRANPLLRGYIVDEQGHLRKHIAVFIDGEHVRDPDALAQSVAAGSEIYVMQALSGG